MRACIESISMSYIGPSTDLGGSGSRSGSLSRNSKPQGCPHPLLMHKEFKLVRHNAVIKIDIFQFECFFIQWKLGRRGTQGHRVNNK